MQTRHVLHQLIHNSTFFADSRQRTISLVKWHESDCYISTAGISIGFEKKVRPFIRNNSQYALKHLIRWKDRQNSLIISDFTSQETLKETLLSAHTHHTHFQMSFNVSSLCFNDYTLGRVTRHTRICYFNRRLWNARVHESSVRQMNISASPRVFDSDYQNVITFKEDESTSILKLEFDISSWGN